MKKIDSIKLAPNELKALDKIRKGVTTLVTVDSIILFGSAVRGERDDESDIDLLIITADKLDRIESHRITDMVFEINLRYDTNYSIIVLDKKTWEEGVHSSMSIKKNIEREGVNV